MTTVYTTNNISGPYVADGFNRDWQYEFQVVDSGDLALFIYDSTGAFVDVVFGYDSDMVVGGLGESFGGFVTYPQTAPAIPAGNSVVLRRLTDLAQIYSFRNQGQFYPELHEKAYDRLTLALNDLQIGTYGSRLLYGAGVPNNITTGLIGDFYLDVTSSPPTMYGPKSETGWNLFYVFPGALNAVITGVVPTVGDLPSGALDGQAYVVQADGDLYVRVSGSWVNAGPVGYVTASLGAANEWTGVNTFRAAVAVDRPNGFVGDVQQHLLFTRGDGGGNELGFFTKLASAGSISGLLLQLGSRVLFSTDANASRDKIYHGGVFYTDIQTLTDAANIAWDASAQQAVVTLSGNRTMQAPTNLVAGAVYRIIVKQDATGGRTLSWSNAIYKFAGGTEPVVAAGANAKTFLEFFYDGTDMICTGVISNYS